MLGLPGLHTYYLPILYHLSYGFNLCNIFLPKRISILNWSILQIYNILDIGYNKIKNMFLHTYQFYSFFGYQKFSKYLFVFSSHVKYYQLINFSFGYLNNSVRVKYFCWHLCIEYRNYKIHNSELHKYIFL